MDQTRALDNREPPSLDHNDDVALSPTSKKVLEQCSVNLTASPGKGFRTLARPPSSGLDSSSGFCFARPTHAVPSFSTRPQSNPAAGGSGIKGRLPLSNADKRSSGEQSEQRSSQNDIVVTAESRQEKISSQPQPAHPDQLIEPMKPFAARSIAANSRSRSGSPKSHGDESKSHSQREAVNHGSIMESGPTASSPPSEPVRQSSCTTAMSSNGNAVEISESKTNEDRRSSPYRPHSCSPSIQGSPASKVTKHYTPQRKGFNSRPIAHPSGLPSQPSEEDLFHLLIHRLKRREQAEAASAALREELERRLRETNEENENLKGQLSQAEKLHKAQEMEKAAQRNLIERWKIKLSKLRNLITVIGNDHETLRKDGQLLRSAQTALIRGKHHIQADLRRLNNSADQVNKLIIKQNAELASVRPKLVELEHSLLLKDSRLNSNEKSLARERSRTAALENFIRNHSSKGLKQMASLLQHQAETSSKIEHCYENFSNLLTNSQSAIKSELELPLKACLELLSALTAREFVDPAVLSQVNSKLQTIIAKFLQEFDTSLKASLKTENELAQVKLANGKLHEKIRASEETLAQLNANNVELKERETSLYNDTKTLKAQVEWLQTQVADISKIAEDSHELSKMRVQFEETSTALNEVTMNLKAKENEVTRLDTSLSEMKSSLECAEMKILTLEAEKAKSEEYAVNIENKVRAEFTKASLLSKEQNRACFEQQLHQLKREKALAEKSVDILKQQSEALKSKLAAAHSSSHSFEATVSENEEKIKALKEGLQKEIASRDETIAKLQEEHISNKREIENVKLDHDRAVAENNRLKADLSEAQATIGNTCQLSLLEEKFDLMRDEGIQKDEKITSLTNELANLQASIKETAILHMENAKDAQGLKDLREKLDEAEKQNAELTYRLKQSDDDIACLTAEMELSKQEGTAMVPEANAQNEDGKSQQTQDDLEGTKQCLSRIESLLRQFGILDANETVSHAWDKVEARLANFSSSSESCEMLLDADNDGASGEAPLQSLKQAGKRKRTVNLTPDAKRVSGRRSSHEYKTTQVVYRKESISRSVSCSPLKSPTLKRPSSRRKQTSKAISRIKPFSQVQWNLEGHQSSPQQSIGDLNKILSGPIDELSKATSFLVPSTPKVQSESTTRLFEVPPSPVKNVKVGSHMMQRKHTNELPRKSQEERTVLQCDDLNGLSQRKDLKTPPSGIFKNTALPTMEGRGLQDMHTPSRIDNPKKKGTAAPRRQTRTSSQYFKSADTPSTILSSTRQTWAVTQSTESAVSYSRPRRYGRRKGKLPAIPRGKGGAKFNRRFVQQ
ncbi:predicted protein [Uncinocarpus reesii 1704]|uniref:Uncharacterized protein n=1 Tax=Uncinocarpus reesii (strain UAMH 1704) TaxID=336963 RepID=C4JGF6_UNCRE|nr:uncharacterized protein UREG_01147 [Uncinocarpus reesii 1704]EEP76298.1 predicted protein [Uncinocarpus reesii 1704]